MQVHSLLAEALFLLFADGSKETLFFRQGTPGKEPLLAGKQVQCVLTEIDTIYLSELSRNRCYGLQLLTNALIRELG